MSTTAQALDMAQEAAKVLLGAAVATEAREVTSAVRAAATRLPGTSAEWRDDGTSHNFLAGPPFLRTSCPHGLVMLQQIHPTAARAVLLSDNTLSVWVDWNVADGDACSLLPAASGPCRLSVRHMGVEVVRADGTCSQPLHLSFDRELVAAGSPFVAELCWHGGRRHLHVLAPPRGGHLNLGGLVLPPASQPNGLAGLLESIAVADAAAPPLPEHAAWLERGFGLEMELLTEAHLSQPTSVPRTAPSASPACRTLDVAAHAGLACSGGSWQWKERTARGCSTSSETQRRCAETTLAYVPTSAELSLAQMKAALMSCRGEVGVGLSPALAAVHAALSSCERWRSEVDVAIQPSPACLASKMLDATAALSAMTDGPARTDARARCMAMLLRRGAIRKSEFQSPSPPHELRFSTGAALEIACFVQGALATMGAAASAVSASAHSGTAVHVHVNVRNTKSGGSVLSAGELLDVVLAWIRFDLVTQTYARPWLWCEPSATPLYATGPEMGTLVNLTWEEVTEADILADMSHRPPAHRAAAEFRAQVANEGFADAAQHWRCHEEALERKLCSVPAFVRAAYEIVHTDGFDDLDSAEQINRLFGHSGPGKQLGRYCSLNLSALIKYGTLEIRRFHGTLDSALLVRWAHFCVCFVEAFAGNRGEHSRSLPKQSLPCETSTKPAKRRSLFLDGHPSAEAALRALQSAQETATSEELMACLAGHLDLRTAAYLAHDACGS